MTRTVVIAVFSCGCALSVGPSGSTPDARAADAAVGADRVVNGFDRAPAPDASTPGDALAPDDRVAIGDSPSPDAGDVLDALPALPDRPVPADGAASERIRRARPSCPDPEAPGCAVVRVIGGSFDMGTGADFLTQGPRPATVDGFAMDSYEVTVSRFRRFFNEGMPPARAMIRYPGGMVPMRGTVREPLPVNFLSPTVWDLSWMREPWMTEQFPVVALTWATAQSFCVWDGGRLPTEAEWEWVAFNLPDGRPLPRTYPYGNWPVECRHANTGCDGSGALTPVGRRASEGLFFDLGGNVAEWTADFVASYHHEYCWGTRPRSNPVCTDGRSGSNQIRGSNSNGIRPSSRDERVPGYYPNYPPELDRISGLTGFRCAYDE